VKLKFKRSLNLRQTSSLLYKFKFICSSLLIWQQTPGRPSADRPLLSSKVWVCRIEWMGKKLRRGEESWRKGLAMTGALSLNDTLLYTNYTNSFAPGPMYSTVRNLYLPSSSWTPYPSNHLYYCTILTECSVMCHK
jgi:hypothetical protein